MADYSWIDPLFKSAKSAFGLDPEAAAKGGLIQRQGDYYDARTANTNAHTSQVIPATVAELTARAGMHGASTKKTEAETVGVGLKNKGAQSLSDFLADPNNYVKTPDGRMVPDTNKLHSAYAAASLSAGDKTIQHLPQFMGGLNLQGSSLSPAANAAAGGANATLAGNLLKPIDLAPDHTLITKDSATGAPVISRPVPNVPVRNNVGSIAPGDFRTAETGTAEMPDGSNLSALMSGVGKPAMGGSPALGPLEPISNVDATFQAPTNKTQIQVGADKNASGERVAAGRNTTTLTKADKDNEARAEVAKLRGASAEEVARIRSGAKAGAGGQASAMDLVRRSNLEKEAVKAVVEGFSAGDTVNPEEASLLASAAIASFPNDPPRAAVQKFMQQEGIRPGSQYFGGTEYLVNNGKRYDFNALRNRLFSQGGQPQAAGGPPASTGASVVPRSTVNAFIPPGMRDESAPPVVIPAQQQAPSVAVGAGSGQAQQPVVQQPAQAPQPSDGSLPAIISDMKGAGVLKPGAQPGFNLGGVDFGHGASTDTSQFAHGEVRLVTPSPNSAPVPMYWNTDTGKFQSEEPPPKISYDQKVRSATSPDRVNSTISVFSDIINGGYHQSGAVSKLEQMTGGKFSAQKYASLSERDRKDYVMSFYDNLVTNARGSYIGDPRIDQFASGDLGEIGVPRDALRLMDLLGGNRKAFGVKDNAGFSESMPYLGVLDMADFGDLASAENRKKIQGFFQAVQEGSFDPKQMKVVDKPKPGRSIDGTDVYEPSEHRIATVRRDMSEMPGDSTLAKAIADKTGPGIVGKAGANLAKAGQNLVNLGRDTGAATNDFFNKTGPRIVGKAGANLAKAGRNLADKGENLVNLGRDTGAATADFFRRIGPGSIKVRSKEDEESDKRRSIEVLRKSKEEADAKDAEREKKSNPRFTQKKSK